MFKRLFSILITAAITLGLFSFAEAAPLAFGTYNTMKGFQMNTGNLGGYTPRAGVTEHIIEELSPAFVRIPVFWDVFETGIGTYTWTGTEQNKLWSDLAAAYSYSRDGGGWLPVSVILTVKSAPILSNGQGDSDVYHDSVYEGSAAPCRPLNSSGTTAFNNFLGHLIDQLYTRGYGGTKYFEIFNEPDNPSTNNPRLYGCWVDSSDTTYGGGDDYAALVYSAYSVVKAKSAVYGPNYYVMNGGFELGDPFINDVLPYPRNNKPSTCQVAANIITDPESTFYERRFLVGYLTYMNNHQSAQNPAHFDYVAIHYYGQFRQESTPGNPEVRTWAIDFTTNDYGLDFCKDFDNYSRYVRYLMNYFQFTTKKMYLTETSLACNLNITSPYNADCFNSSTLHNMFYSNQTAFLQQMNSYIYYHRTSSPFVLAYIWHTASNNGWRDSDLVYNYSGWGVSPGQPKPVWTTFAGLANH